MLVVDTAGVPLVSLGGGREGGDFDVCDKSRCFLVFCLSVCLSLCLSVDVWFFLNILFSGFPLLSFSYY